MRHLHLLALALLLTLLPPALHAAEADGILRIIVFGGHPDDAEFKAGGTAVKWARLGHPVKLVSAEKMPVYLFTSDDFTAPRPFKPDLEVALDDVFDQKLDGEEAGRAVQFAETFEFSEYGRQPSPEELRKLFPFFGAK